MSKIRALLLFLGPLLGKYNLDKLVKPGGDRIGSRPLTAHIIALSDLGFQIQETQDSLLITRHENKIKNPGEIWLTEQSVSATEILMLISAFLNRGSTLTLYGAATEPHIVTLANLLSQMGARIDGSGSSLVKITWPEDPGPPSEPFRIDDDFMELTTYAVAAAITKSDITLNSPEIKNLKLIDRYLQWLGISTRLDDQAKTWVVQGSQSNYKIHPQLTTIKAEPWPRFPTDVMSLFVPLATQCHGELKFIEYMYNDRFTFVQSLKDMGAKIEENPPPCYPRQWTNPPPRP